MISTFQYAQMLARLNKDRRANQEFPEAESEIGRGGLHEQIDAYARSKGWLVIHSRTDKPATNSRGTPDFILGADNGVTYWIECKRKGSKPTTEQLGMILMLKLLGHKAAIVWSFEEFLEVVK